MTTFNFGILGTGVAAEFHRQAIRANEGEGANLSVVAHYEPERFDEFSEAFGVPCTTEEEMLRRSDVDAVCICTPSGQHADQTVRAAEAGKHVLVEKPMALSLEDASRMIAACERAGVQLGVVFQRRAESLFRKVRRAIDAGDLGELTLAVVAVPYVREQSYYDSAAWRGTWSMDGGGAVMNQGIHLVDLLVWYMGDPQEVKVHTGTLQRDVEVEDTLAASLRFEGGAMGTLAATTTASPGFPHRIEIYGTEGGIQIEGERVRRWTLQRPAGAQVEPPRLEEAGGAGSGGAPEDIELEGHIGIVRDFMQAVRDGRPPLVDGREGCRSLETVLAVYRDGGLQ